MNGVCDCVIVALLYIIGTVDGLTDDETDGDADLCCCWYTFITGPGVAVYLCGLS